MVFSDGYLVTCNLKCCQSDNCNMGGEFPTASTNPLASSSPPHSNPQTMPLTTAAISPSPDRSTSTEPDSTLTTTGGTGPVTDSSTHRASSANPSTPSSSPPDTNSPALLVITIMCGSLLIALLNGGR
ncbi:putative protein TPRXL [Nematostella vectensis]|uniref:putative protein TPRXL n=1 Tax=Nematostella vectensis TaxID=45351 RepID=UPI0020774F85|nr:putative protein TPRXL [Nematostella vectensis]